MKNIYKRLKYYFEKHEKLMMPLTMAFGFVIDSFTLRRVDLWIENLIIISYLALVISSIYLQWIC